MVKHYLSHLDKEYVLADLTTRLGQVGLRWRTQDKVKRGKGQGQETCGNKHCHRINNNKSSMHITQQQKQLKNNLMNKKSKRRLQLLTLTMPMMMASNHINIIFIALAHLSAQTKRRDAKDERRLMNSTTR